VSPLTQGLRYRAACDRMGARHRWAKTQNRPDDMASHGRVRNSERIIYLYVKLPSAVTNTLYN